MHSPNYTLMEYKERTVFSRGFCFTFRRGNQSNCKKILERKPKTMEVALWENENTLRTFG